MSFQPSAALYYPHTSIANEGLLKKALLLWDHVDVITPYSGFRSSVTSHFREAHDLIVQSHHPTVSEQRIAHKMIDEAFRPPLPDWMFTRSSKFDSYIYTEKLMYLTWRLLRNRNLVKKQGGRAAHAWTNERVGLIIMAILAEACAGKTKRKITDEAGAYRSLSKCIALGTGGGWKNKVKAEDEVLMSVAFKTLNLSNIDLKALVRLRKAERSDPGNSYVDMRRKLLRKLEEHSAELMTVAMTDTDRKEYERNFEEQLKRDYADLADELGIVGRNFTFSKEMGGLVVASAAALGVAAILPPAAPAAAGAYTVGAGAMFGGALLVSPFDKYRTDRKKVLKDHVTSYLYMAKHSRFEWDIGLWRRKRL